MSIANPYIIQRTERTRCSECASHVDMLIHKEATLPTAQSSTSAGRAVVCLKPVLVLSCAKGEQHERTVARLVRTTNSYMG